MNRDHIPNIAAWGSLGLILMAHIFFKKEMSSCPFSTGLIWLSGVITYGIKESSLGSRKPSRNDVKNSVITCLIIGCIAGFNYGESSSDSDGNIDSEGFHTTFDSKAGEGVKFGMTILFGSIIGLWVLGMKNGLPHEDVRAEKNTMQGDGNRRLYSPLSGDESSGEGDGS